jgi:hypothetical protein
MPPLKAMTMVQETRKEQKARGMRHVLLAIIAAALMVLPSYVAYLMVRRLRVDIGITAVVALVLFLIGAFLLVTLISD